MSYFSRSALLIALLVFWSSFSNAWMDITDACSTSSSEGFVCVPLVDEVVDEVGFESNVNHQVGRDGTRDVVLSVSAKLESFQFTATHVYLRNAAGLSVFGVQAMSSCTQDANRCFVEFYVPDDNELEIEISFAYRDASSGVLRIYRYILPKNGAV